MASSIGVTTTVRVRDLPILADIGINPDEIGRRQPLVITVELTLDTVAVRNLEDAVDYRWIAREAEVLSGIHISLIETFAHELASRCMTRAMVARARVNIYKTLALATGISGVEVYL